jgi:UDP-N-acetylglucosamine 2-epimerase (non-hydrolysing)
MIDSMVKMQPRIAAAQAAGRFGLTRGKYGIVTLHRPANVDTASVLDGALRAMMEVSSRLPLVFPMHPRTRDRIVEFGFASRVGRMSKIIVCKPLGYIDFMSLLTDAALVITDSGGLQEETCYLGIPCLTVRKTTERPITIAAGTNRLTAMDELPEAIARILEDPEGVRWRTVPEFWDGNTAGRVVASLARVLA